MKTGESHKVTWLFLWKVLLYSDSAQSSTLKWSSFHSLKRDQNTVNLFPFGFFRLFSLCFFLLHFFVQTGSQIRKVAQTNLSKQRFYGWNLKLLLCFFVLINWVKATRKVTLGVTMKVKPKVTLPFYNAKSFWLADELPDTQHWSNSGIKESRDWLTKKTLKSCLRNSEFTTCTWWQWKRPKSNFYLYICYFHSKCCKTEVTNKIKMWGLCYVVL